MLIRQLKRNYMLLGHSNQRFTLLLELYEPYENIYQQQILLNNNAHQQQQQSSSNAILFAYFNYLHEAYQTIKDRIKKIELKMDLIESCTDAAQKYESSRSNSSPCGGHDLDQQQQQQINTSKLNHIDLIKLYEYQIVEMQHEYELLLEDKVS